MTRSHKPTPEPKSKSEAPDRDKPMSPADDPPIAPPEGGHRSDRDGKFEADHRPSR